MLPVSEFVSAVLSLNGPERTRCVLVLSSGKLKIVPFLTLPTNRLSLYFDPRLSVCKNRTEVGAIVSIHINSGSLYMPFPPKVSNF